MKEKIKNFAHRVWKCKIAYLFLAPLIVGMIVFCYYPPILAVIRSFTDWHIGMNENWNLTFANYTKLFKDQIFLDSIGTMFLLNIPTLIISVVVPLVFAEMLYWVKWQKLSAVYRVLVLLPIITPGVINTYLWTFIYQSNGLLNDILGAIGFNFDFNWLNNLGTVIFACIFMGFPWVGGTNVLIYLSGLMNIPTEISEAARLDGAGTFRIIVSLHIPSVLGQIRYFLVFGIIGAFQNYGIQVTLSGSGVVNPEITNSAIMVPGYYMYRQAFEFNNSGYACAIGTILFVFVMIITALTFKVFHASKFELD